MSSGIGAIYDDYRDYRRLCEKLGEQPVAGLPLASMDLWEQHWKRLKAGNEKVRRCQDGLPCKKPGECEARGKCHVFKGTPMEALEPESPTCEGG